MKTLSIIILILAAIFTSYSQEKINTEVKCEVKENSKRNNQNFMQPSVKQVEIEKKILDAKNSGKTEEVISLQRSLDQLSGNSTTIPVEKIDAKITQGAELMMSPDSTGLSAITAESNILGVTTLTEQRGANIGRIWAITAISGTQNVVRFSYSDNNGTSWIPYGSFTYNTGINITADEIDAEIIEDVTGAKYIWAVLGTKNGLVWKVIGSVMNITTFAANTFYLDWPGISTGDYYYKPRICSDNAHFTNNPWIYIICDYDSTTAAGYNSGAKVCRCLLPYTTNPTMTYRGDCYFGTIIYRRPYFYDISYFQNGGADSIVVVESSLSDSNTIYIGASSIGSYTQSTHFAGYIQNNGEVKNYAYVASNGAYNQLMIVCREKYSANLWDVTYYRSSNGSGGWVRNYIDGRFVNKSRPDIVGKRNVAGMFFCSYSTIDSYDSVFYATSIGYNWNSPVGPKNHLSSTTIAGPRPGFTLSTGETCFSIWAGTNNGVWGSKGCSPVVIGITQNNTTVPNKFELFQNYPNPFNPTTNIKFNVIKVSNVSITVFDILGKQVAELVNEKMNAGEYTTDWNASNMPSGIYFYRIKTDDFTDTKKMMLIK